MRFYAAEVSQVFNSHIWVVKEKKIFLLSLWHKKKTTENEDRHGYSFQSLWGTKHKYFAISGFLHRLEKQGAGVGH